MNLCNFRMVSGLGYVSVRFCENIEVLNRLTSIIWTAKVIIGNIKANVECVNLRIFVVIINIYHNASRDTYQKGMS